MVFLDGRNFGAENGAGHVPITLLTSRGQLPAVGWNRDRALFLPKGTPKRGEKRDGGDFAVLHARLGRPAFAFEWPAASFRLTAPDFGLTIIPKGD